VDGDIAHALAHIDAANGHWRFSFLFRLGPP
jgi:hypothetical protein